MLGDRIARIVALASACVSLAGLAAELGGWLLGWPERPVDLLSLSYEANVPTWYASSLLVLCAAALAACAERAPTDRAGWWALSAIFAFLSLDEAIEIHEHLASIAPGHGVLFFGWVIPGLAITLALGLAFLRFVLRLPAPDRARVVAAGAIYVGGALGMELPLGWWTERHGDAGLGYALIDWVEESLELAGATMFLLALRARLARSEP